MMKKEWKASEPEGVSSQRDIPIKYCVFSKQLPKGESSKYMWETANSYHLTPTVKIVNLPLLQQNETKSKTQIAGPGVWELLYSC